MKDFWECVSCLVHFHTALSKCFLLSGPLTFVQCETKIEQMETKPNVSISLWFGPGKWTYKWKSAPQCLCVSFCVFVCVTVLVCKQRVCVERPLSSWEGIKSADRMVGWLDYLPAGQCVLDLSIHGPVRVSKPPHAPDGWTHPSLFPSSLPASPACLYVFYPVLLSDCLYCFFCPPPSHSTSVSILRGRSEGCKSKTLPK